MSAENDALLFGRNLVLARRRRGYSQAALALRAGISTDGVQKIELGKRSPYLRTILALSDALAIDPRILFEGMRP